MPGPAARPPRPSKADPRVAISDGSSPASATGRCIQPQLLRKPSLSASSIQTSKVKMRDLLKRSHKQRNSSSKVFTMAPEESLNKQHKLIAVDKMQLQRIPQPPTVPVVGNLTCLDLDDPSSSFAHLASRHGPIYRFSVPGQDMIIVSSWKLVNEACDDSRFKKSLQGDLEVLPRCKLLLTCWD